MVMNDKIKLLYFHRITSMDSFKKINIFCEFIKKEIDCEVIVLLEDLIDRDRLEVFKNIDYFDSIENYIDMDSKLNDAAVKLFSNKYSNINYNYLRLPIGGKNRLYNSGNNFYIYLIKYIYFFHNYLINKSVDVALCTLLTAYNNSLIPILQSVCTELNIKTIFILRSTYSRLFISENINLVPSNLEETYISNLNKGLSDDKLKKVKKAMESFIKYVKSPAYRKIMWRL